MLSTVPGSVDGFQVASYEAGQEYDLTATAGAKELAVALVDAGLAEEVGAKVEPPAEADHAANEDGGEGAEAPAPTRPSRRAKAQ